MRQMSCCRIRKRNLAVEGSGLYSCPLCDGWRLRLECLLEDPGWAEKQSDKMADVVGLEIKQSNLKPDKPSDMIREQSRLLRWVVALMSLNVRAARGSNPRSPPAKVLWVGRLRRKSKPLLMQTQDANA